MVLKLRILITVFFLFLSVCLYSAVDAVKTEISNSNVTMPDTNNINLSNQFVSEINPQKADPGRNVIFDNYDEVVIENYEKDNVTHIKFIGNVKIRFEGNILKARTVVITSSSNKILEIAAYEKVEFHYGDSIYLADYMNFNPETKKGTLKNVRSYVKETGGQPGLLTTTTGWFYHAKKATIMSEDRVILEDVNLTFTPAEMPQYQFYAQKLWYFKGSIMFALHDTYTVGQGDFFYMPFYFRWEKFTGIKTSFGQEIRIGWYLMNTAYLDLDDFNAIVGLDVYERLGQYSLLKLNSKHNMGIFRNLNFYGEGANDQRVMYDSVNDRYSQLVYVNDTINGQSTNYYTNIQQLSWHYSVDTTIATNNFTLNIHWEDLNDPFFTRKYNSRREAFDPIKEAILNSENSFYGSGRDDLNPYVSSYTRSFNLNYYNFNLSGSWLYNYRIDPSVSNTFLNDRYKFYLYQLSFPNMSYSTGSIDIFRDINYSFPVSKKMQLSNTNITLGLNEDADAAFLKYSMQTNGSMTNSSNITVFSNTNSVQTIPENGLTNDSTGNVDSQNAAGELPPGKEPVSNKPAAQTNIGMPVSDNLKPETNQIPLTNDQSGNINLTNTGLLPAGQMISSKSYQLVTNNYELYNFSSLVNANINYSPSETLDTNQQSTPISDKYHHVETGNYIINGRLLNSLITWNNTFNFQNDKYWSTFTNDDINNLNASGYSLNFTSDASIRKILTLNTNNLFEINFPYSIEHNFYYELFRTTYATYPRIYSHTTTFGTGFNMFKDNLDYGINGSHFIQYRITNNMDDIYIDNVMQRTLNATTSLKVTWLKASTSISLNILETKTNFFALTYGNFTNRLNPVGTIPLTMELDPPDEYNPAPNITYTYDLIKQTNLSFDTTSKYAIQNIYGLPVYKLSNLTFYSSFHWDFMEPRNSKYSLSLQLSLLFNPYWEMNFETAVENNKLYLYFRDNETRYHEKYVEFWGNLLDSINIFDYNALKRGNFKIQRYKFSLEHYLNEWTMSMNFSLTRQLSPDGLTLFWDPEILIRFTLEGLNQGFPDYTKKFVPPQYQ